MHDHASKDLPAQPPFGPRPRRMRARDELRRGERRRREPGRGRARAAGAGRHHHSRHGGRARQCDVAHHLAGGTGRHRALDVVGPRHRLRRGARCHRGGRGQASGGGRRAGASHTQGMRYGRRRGVPGLRPEGSARGGPGPVHPLRHGEFRPLQQPGPRGRRSAGSAAYDHRHCRLQAVVRCREPDPPRLPRFRAHDHEA